MPGDELSERATAVSTRMEFLEFLQHLIQDHAANGAEWDNATLRQFLEGLHGFASDMAGYYKNMGDDIDVEKITWRLAADMLLAATVYE